MSRTGNDNSDGGNVADLTLRMLRDIRANMATKDDLAKLEARMDAKMDARFAAVDARFQVLTRVVKDNHRVFSRRVRALEIRVNARRRR